MTDKQKAFCQEYLVDLNATQAAIRAGYSSHTAREIAAETLSKPYIQEEIARLMAERSKRTEISADEVLQRFHDWAFAERHKAFKLSGNTLVIASMEEWPPALQSCITGIEQTKTGIKITFTDPIRAMENLGRHLGIYNDSLNLNTGLSIAEIEAQIAALSAKYPDNK